MKLSPWFLLPCALAIVAVGCSSGGFSKRQSASGDGSVFRYPIVTNPTSLDPHRVEDGDTIDLLQQVYEGLVTWGEDSKVKPLLAEKWEEQDGGKTYLFTLKKGVKFHNGREVTAEDVKWSFERAADPALKSPIAGTYLNDIVGVTDKLNGKATEVSGVKVVGPLQVSITIDQPRVYFLDKLTYLCAAVLPKESVPAQEPISKPEEMDGTGPFRCTQFIPNQSAKLEAFKEYHDGAPKVDQIDRPVILDAATRLLKYKNGELDLVMLERQDVEGIKQDPKLEPELKFFDRPAIWYLGMAPNSYPPFRDRRVRRAFAMAVDKEVIVNELLGGVNKVANGILPAGVSGHRESANFIQFNPEQGRKLLAEAGYPGGKGLPPLEMNFRDSRPDVKTAAVAIAGQLKEHLGVTVNIRSMEWAAYLEKRNRSELQIFHMRWAADYLDPENFLSLMLSTTGAENRMGYSNKEFDALCARADTMPASAERLELYARAEDIVLQDAPWVPIYFQRDAELISSKVKGLRESVFGHLPHTSVRLEK